MTIKQYFSNLWLAIFGKQPTKASTTVRPKGGGGPGEEYK